MSWQLQLALIFLSAAAKLRIMLCSTVCGSGSQNWVVGQFDYGRIVNRKTDSPKRISGACQNPVIDPVNAARFMTAASTL
jgi:hypothetical protein